MRKNTKNQSFNFKDVIVKYDELDKRKKLIYAYYLTTNHKYNKEINDIIIDFWYTRNRLVRNYPTLNRRDEFEYERLGIYVENKHLEELKAEINRRDKIREWHNAFISWTLLNNEEN